MSSQQPDLSALLEQWWGGYYAGTAALSLISAASNIVIGGNSAWGPNEFFTAYPKFGGTPIPNLAGDTQAGSAQLTLSATAPASLKPGLYISDALQAAIPPATQITVVNGTLITMSNEATATVTGDVLYVYPASTVPLPVVVMYIALAQACLQYNRWLEQWNYAMALFTAHYCTLWLRSEGNPGTTAGQLAASGLEKGIIVSKSAGDVSAGSQLPSGLESWGAWQETTYGVQLATLAKIVGWGPMYIY